MRMKDWWYHLYLRITTNKMLILTSYFETLIYLFVFSFLFDRLITLNYIEYLFLSFIGLILFKVLIRRIFELKENEDMAPYFTAIPVSLNHIISITIGDIYIRTIIEALPVLVGLAIIRGINIIIYFLFITIFVFYLTTFFTFMVSYMSFTFVRAIVFPSGNIIIRLSTIFYPLIVIPLLFKIFVIINPLTWLSEVMRSDNLLLVIVAIVVFLIVWYVFYLVTLRRYKKYYYEIGVKFH